MGNSGGKPTVVIQTDGASFYAGTKITGRVYLNVPSEGYRASTLKVGVYGKEETCVHYTETERVGFGSDERTETYDRYAQESRNILNLEANLALFPSQHAPLGQYEYPFELNLPNHLPTQFYCRSGQSNCFVNYHMEVRLHREGLFKPDVHHRQQICILTNPRIYGQESVRLPPDTQDVNFCCCINKGSITLGADADKDIFHRNERFRVGFSVNNKSSVDVKRIKVFVREYVRWRAYGRTASGTRDVALVPFAPSECRGAQPFRASLSDNIRKADDAERMFSPFTTNQAESANLIIDPSARDSYNGVIVNIDHKLCVVAETPCCMTSPEVSTPVYVQPDIPNASAVVIDPSPEFLTASSVPINEQEPYLSVPTGWSPTIASNVTVVPSNVIIGGQNGIESTGYQNPDVYGIIPSAPPLTSFTGDGNSLEGLMNNLASTFDHVGVTKNFIETSEGVVKNLTPREVVTISNKISFPLDNLNALQLISESMGNNFTTAHLRALLDSTYNVSHRLSLLKKLTMMVSDFQRNKGIIFETLDSFEREEFERYLERQGLLL